MSFFGKKKESAPPPTIFQTAPSVTDESLSQKEKEKKKRIGRAALILTSPQGDLSKASTASGQLLGN